MQPFVTMVKVTRVNRIERGYSDACAESTLLQLHPGRSITFGIGWLVVVCLSTDLHASPTKKETPLFLLTAAEGGWGRGAPRPILKVGWGLASSGGVEGCSGAL